jgi:ubiquitin C-terminal hydrolase
MEENKVGLRNRGNTCYLNSALQSLYHLKKFQDYFIQNLYNIDLNNRFYDLKKNKENNHSLDYIHLTKEFGKLIKAIHKSTSSIEPKSFHELIQKYNNVFSGNDQQDAQEVMNLVLDYLHEGLKYDIEVSFSGVVQNNIDKLVLESFNSWKKDLNNKYSIIIELFYGQFLNEIYPLNNNNKILSRTFEMFNILNIPLYGNTLYDSLNKYFSKEILETKYLNEKTNEKIDAYRIIKLMKIPKYLIIVLKRFSNTSYLTKLNQLLSFPIDDLDLSNYLEGYEKINCTMKLISITCHKGILNGGHYYALCRNINNKWFKYDDENVYEYNIFENNTIFKDGYILIYEKNE